MELRERLRLALKSRAEPPPAGVAAAAAPPSPTPPTGCPPELQLQREQSRWGPVYLTEEWWPLDYRHGRRALRDALSLDASALSRLAPGLSARDLASAAFIDVETTGLAGGTGTYVFLVGLGTFEDDAFRLRQFFLSDLRGEPAMLAAVGETLAGCRSLVSFNGRRFDLPLLETRLTLSRLPPPAPGLPHLDLLYPARRLYRRRLPSCRLAYLEETLLGLHREDDVPGWAIPALYFDYVRSGRAGPLRAVFRHNARDILSLVTLLAHLGRLAGGTPPADPGDCLALARWDESAGRLTDAARLYATALEGEPDDEDRTFARRRLARLYRRLGRWEDAVRLWREEAGNGRSAERKLEALIELAKLEEHRRRNYAVAAALTQRALRLQEVRTLRGAATTTPMLQREALEHRLWRLRRRLAASRLAVNGRRRPEPGA